MATRKVANHPVLHVSHVSLVFQDIHQKPIEFCQLCEKAERKINFKGQALGIQTVQLAQFYLTDQPERIPGIIEGKAAS